MTDNPDAKAMRSILLSAANSCEEFRALVVIALERIEGNPNCGEAKMVAHGSLVEIYVTLRDLVDRIRIQHPDIEQRAQGMRLQ
jgi:hypothetical protein